MTLYTILYEDGHCEYPAVCDELLSPDKKIEAAHAKAVEQRPKVNIVRIMRRSNNEIIWGTK